VSDYSEMKQYIERWIARGLDTPELDGAEVLALINELERVKTLNHQQFGDAIRKNAEVEALKRGMVGDYDLDAWLEFSTGSVQKDADRYRWICDGNGYFMEEQMLCGHSNDKAEADRQIDIAISTGERP
jgi:hypothetical protein